MKSPRTHARRRRSVSVPPLQIESLEDRIVLAASIGFDARQGLVSIVGSETGDVALVRLQGSNVVVSLTGIASKSFKAFQVRLVDFKGLGGDDSFTNNTAIRSRADGGPGRDTLRGGSNIDDLRGGGDDDKVFGNAGNDVVDGGVGNDREYGDAGEDHLYGGTGDDSLYGGADNDDIYGDAGNDGLYGETGDDILDGRSGRDRIFGGPGLDREDDLDDSFGDGDDDGDGYDNDHDRPVSPGVATLITFTESAPGVETAQLIGESTSERDRKYYTFTATAARTLTVAIAPDAAGRHAKLEVKDATTGRELLELEPAEDGIALAQMRVAANSSYVIKVNSPYDNLSVGYTVNLTLDDRVISPIIGTQVTFDPAGFAQLTGTIAGDAKRIYSFTAASTGSLNVGILPVNGRFVDVEVRSRSTGRKLLELEPSDRYGRASGTVAIVAGETYVIEIESPFETLAVDFAVNLQLS